MSDERDPIDASLQRLFAPPDFTALQAKIDAAAAEVPRSARRRAPTVLITIAALAAAAAAVLVLSTRGDRSALPPEPDADREAPLISARQHAGVQLARFYAQGPDLPRADDGSCVGPPPAPASCLGDAPEPSLPAADLVDVIGECGARGGTSCAGYEIPAARLVHLRVRPDGPEVLVCVEPRELDPQPMLPADAGLSIFRRELGDFILYEITPLTEPRVLDHFFL
jgi:hypothetical protein